MFLHAAGHSDCNPIQFSEPLVSANRSAYKISKVPCVREQGELDHHVNNLFSPFANLRQCGAIDAKMPCIIVLLNTFRVCVTSRYPRVACLGLNLR